MPWALFVATLLKAACGFAQHLPAASPERRAVRFLAVEVPKWKQENGCYSCHNNGDAARALMVAARDGMLADRAPVADTVRFLATPERWDDNGPDGPFKDKKLARIQFAAALVEAVGAGLIADQGTLERAAALVAETQTPEGNWEIDAPGNFGSPATYGRALASFMAMRTLAAAGQPMHRAALTRASRWFLATEPKSVLDAAATLWALVDDKSRPAQAQRGRSLELIRGGQSTDGGWGPFVNAPPESFDTAVVLLALAAQEDRARLGPLIARGREYLLARQAEDGGWPPTTRPPGADSYAQRLSTSGWATLALLATRPITATGRL
ncbi:MAG: hypothetical protein WD063_18025 [Pirellulales bacterium]